MENRDSHRRIRSSRKSWNVDSAAQRMAWGREPHCGSAAYRVATSGRIGAKRLGGDGNDTARNSPGQCLFSANALAVVGTARWSYSGGYHARSGARESARRGGMGAVVVLPFTTGSVKLAACPEGLSPNHAIGAALSACGAHVFERRIHDVGAVPWARKPT